MAEFEPPSFSLGLDLEFEAPSFSLGFDFDTEPRPAPSQPPLLNQSPPPTTTAKSHTTDPTEDFQPETLDPDLQVEDSDPDLQVDESPPILKRLKRGFRNRASVKREPRKVISSAENEIEDLSSQEDVRRDKISLQQNRSVCGTSKFLPQGYCTPTAQFVAKAKAQPCVSASNASAFTSMESGSNNLMFPKLTVSPPRRFHFLDSDLDEPSVSEILSEDAYKVDTSIKERQCNTSQSKVENLQKRNKIPLTMPRIDDLWKDFSLKKCVNIPTPALDEFCEEYFSSVNDYKSVTQSKEDDTTITSSKGCYQESCMSESELYGNQPNSLFPAYKYFYHADPRIKRLVRQRLPNFSPLIDANVGVKDPFDAADIDYMCQFGQRDSTPLNQGPKGSSRRSKKCPKVTITNEMPEVSGSWMNPKTHTSIPKNAGKRRISAGGRGGGSSAGSWYTSPEGRKVYVTKNGQELTGPMAYRHYKKASGTGFRSKKSRKKPASKNKAASRKKAKR